MTTMRQGDLFAAASATVRPSTAEAPEPETIRARLHAILALLRDACEMPWEPLRARTQEYLFTNMAEWLPQEERDALRREFAAQMSRLRTAAP
jgi:hypothetical protein